MFKKFPQSKFRESFCIGRDHLGYIPLPPPYRDKGLSQVTASKIKLLCACFDFVSAIL